MTVFSAGKEGVTWVIRVEFGAKLLGVDGAMHSEGADSSYALGAVASLLGITQSNAGVCPKHTQ